MVSAPNRLRLMGTFQLIFDGASVALGQPRLEELVALLALRPGTPLMSVVPLQSVYVVANFKETQIENFRPGQTVTIRPDVAHNLRLHGTVDSLAPASGSEFSIIPTDTATGNFTKIVQRVPVRIRLDPGQEGLQLLRPGLSAAVTVDTRE